MFDTNLNYIDDTLDMWLRSLGPTSPCPSAMSSETAARRTAAPTSAVMCRMLHFVQNQKHFNKTVLHIQKIQRTRIEREAEENTC